MGFWIFMLLMALLIPAAMTGFGKRFFKAAPKKINATWGYRTSMSMKNRETWEFAHQYFGKLWFRWGLVLLPVSAIAMALGLGKSDDLIGGFGIALACVQLIPMIGAIIPTEKALKKTFDSNGARR